MRFSFKFWNFWELNSELFGDLLLFKLLGLLKAGSICSCNFKFCKSLIFFMSYSSSADFLSLFVLKRFWPFFEILLGLRWLLSFGIILWASLYPSDTGVVLSCTVAYDKLNWLIFWAFSPEFYMKLPPVCDSLAATFRVFVSLKGGILCVCCYLIVYKKC